MKDDLFPSDPRYSNRFRAELMSIVTNLVPSPNFKVQLEIDSDSNNLVLKILKRKPLVFKAFGFTLWRHTPSWNNSICIQRRLTARTYEDMVAQIHAKPEFLEFEITVEGTVQYQVAVHL